MSVATVTSISDYRNRVAGLPLENFVGSLVWYSIAGSMEYGDGKKVQVPVRVTRDQLAAWFQDLGLDEAFLPKQIQKVDAFRSASSAVKASWAIDDRRTARLRVEEIDFNPEFVLRHIIQDITDAAGQKQISAHVATLKFFRGARSASGKNHSAEHYKTAIKSQLEEIGLDGRPTGRKFPFPPEDRARVADFITEFDAKYTDLAANLDSDAIRSVLRSYVLSLNAVLCNKGGAVYFVHNTRQDVLDRLQELVRRIGQGCTFYQVPLLDTAEQRNMLTDKFESRVEEDCYKLLEQIKAVNDDAKKKSKGKIKPSRYASIKAMYDEIMRRSEEYTNMLGLAQGRSASALELALESLFDMAERVEA